MDSQGNIELLSRKKNIAREVLPGDENFQENFSDQILKKIIDHNFKK